MKISAFKSGIVLLVCAVLSARGATPVLNSDFHSVLRSGDVRKLREVLDNGASPNARDTAGNTPLMHAAVYGDLACMRLLLDLGAEINAANSEGATALMRAAFDYEKVRLLVDRGADVKARSGFGNTALMLAARPANSHRTVELLLARGADAKDANHFGATALMSAVASGDEKSARLLLKHGANVNAQPTPDEPGFVFGGGRSALMWAAFRGNLPMMKLLLEAGANPNEIGGMGTPLSHAAWSGQTAAARLLIERGARVDQAGPRDGFTALHWATSTESRDPSLVQLLLEHKADPNLGGGEPVDAYLGVDQTPLMLARRRGNTQVLGLLSAARATNATQDPLPVKTPPARRLPEHLDEVTTRAAIALAVVPLQKTSIESKKAFVAHESRQDCTSCHQQHLPLAAVALARKRSVSVDLEAERQLVKMVGQSEVRNPEMDWQPLFHPDAAHTKGYQLFSFASQDVPGGSTTDAWVHHLAAIQGEQGQWYNNLPRPPIQTSDVGATALGIHALQRYALPGRKAEFAKKVDLAREWLWKAKPQNNEERIYQLLGLAWAGESSRKLQPLAKALLAEQRSDGGWAQLPGLNSDAYATAQAIYALRVGARLPNSDAGVERGLRYLLQTQLADGTWHVRRRAFPFQPTMNSGFPHGRDSWISAAATSWAVMALSLPERPNSSLVMAAHGQ
jgi:ankyrin repeat protein